jgi:hypothetical protein
VRVVPVTLKLAFCLGLGAVFSGITSVIWLKISSYDWVAMNNVVSIDRTVNRID